RAAARRAEAPAHRARRPRLVGHRRPPRRDDEVRPEEGGVVLDLRAVPDPGRDPRPPALARLGAAERPAEGEPHREGVASARGRPRPAAERGGGRREARRVARRLPGAAHARRRDEHLQPGGPRLRERRGAPQHRAAARGGRGGPARRAARAGAGRAGGGGDRPPPRAREDRRDALLPRGAHDEGGGRGPRAHRVARLAAPLAGDAPAEGLAPAPLRAAGRRGGGPSMIDLATTPPTPPLDSPGTAPVERAGDRRRERRRGRDDGAAPAGGEDAEEPEDRAPDGPG